MPKWSIPATALSLFSLLSIAEIPLGSLREKRNYCERARGREGGGLEQDIVLSVVVAAAAASTAAAGSNGGSVLAAAAAAAGGADS